MPSEWAEGEESSKGSRELYNKGKQGIPRNEA